MTEGPRLAIEVEQFATPSFALAEDLRNLVRVHQTGATEAIIFYCSRTLEALASSAVELMQLDPSMNVFSNLVILEQYGLLARSVEYWAHGLRRMGNDVRHVLRTVNEVDAEVALLHVERWLDWYFCRFPLGPRLECITGNGSHLQLATNREWRGIIAAIEAAQTPAAMAAVAAEPTVRQVCSATPTISAVLAEGLLEMGQPKLAGEIVAAALTVFPGEMRLRQLQGLAWSRQGELDAARQCLESLRAERFDDEETAGILAGVYKRLWDGSSERREWLKKSRATYRESWTRSHKRNAYLGINAATTALWLGETDDCQALAAQVHHVLHERRKRVGHAPNNVRLDSYWDLISLAEADLLLGDWAAADQGYAAAQAQYPERSGSFQVARKQVERILAALGHADHQQILPSLDGGPAP